MKPLKDIVRELKHKNIDDVRIIPASRIALANWVPVKCRYGCSLYGKSWSCPPSTPPFEEAERMIRGYRTALFIRFRPGSRGKAPQDTVLNIERTLFLSGYHKAFAFFPEPCSECKKCAYPKNCKHPDRRRPTTESFGVDFFTTAKNIGVRMEVLQEKKSYILNTLVLVE